MQDPIFIMPSLPHLKLAFFLNVPILLGLLGVFLVFYSVVTSVIVYHWYAYGMRSKGILIAETLFFMVTVGLFVAAAISLFYF